MATQIFTWFILSYGLMNIMVFGKIFSGVRDFFKEWGEADILLSSVGKFISGILSCPMCFGFHGGWFLSLTIFSPCALAFGSPTFISWFFDGILSSGAVWAINSIIEWFEQNRPVYERRLTIKEEENNKQIL